jgi:RNA polymerase sigma-70 factor (ECF subfamily)
MSRTEDPERVARAVAKAHAEEWAFVLATTVRFTQDLDLAEDCVQDAYAQALVNWPVSGIPRRPGAWLTTVATRRALEQYRRAATLARKLPLLITDATTLQSIDAADEATFPDDRLRLIFTCCHPAIAPDAQLALTLRLVCGLTSAEVARAFLVREATMQARITRAKRKIAEARIPYRTPGPDDLPERVGVVLDAIHLLYSSGYTAAAGNDLIRTDLAARALDLATMMRTLLPGNAEVMGLLALLHLTEARRPARVRDSGELVLMEDQDRDLWDRAAIADGLTLLHAALAHPPAGRYTLMAAIAAVHAEAPDWDGTDWHQIVGLYDILLRRWPSPVVALNRAVALSFAEGPAVALEALGALAADPPLTSYAYLASTRADFLRRTGRTGEALAAYEEALSLTENAAEADFLSRRIDALCASGASEQDPAR